MFTVTPVILKQFIRLLKNNKIAVLEDAAEAFGSTYLNQKIGSLSDYTAFSLYINKVIACGEGGMITHKSKPLYHELKRLNDYYFSSKRHFWRGKIGYNFRMSNIQAAVGLGQIQHTDDLIFRKQKIYKWYKIYLSDISEYLISLTENPDGISNYWHVAFRARKLKFNIMKLRILLGQNGIETRSHFLPLYMQPVYRKPIYFGKYPNSELLAQTGVLFPSGPALSEDQVNKICNITRRYFQK